MEQKLLVVLMFTFLTLESSLVLTAERRGSVQATTTDRSREILIRLRDCKSFAIRSCQHVNKSLKDYLRCFKGLLNACLYIAYERNSMERCEEQNFTRFTDVCWHDECVTVEFTITECIHY